MKMLSLLLSFACLQLAATGYSQEITISLKNAPLEKAFKEIEKQTPYHFFYTTEAISLSHKVTIEVKNESLENVLKLCFNNQPITFSIEEKFILVKIAEEKKNPANQFIDVKGKVVNDNGEPLAGITVRVKGSGKMAMTDVNGEFVITDINPNDILIISGAETETIELKVNGKDFLTIALSHKVKELDQTIVIGYGTTTRRYSTGSVSKVTAEEISKQPVSNPLAALEGRVPGLTISQTTGVSGGNFNVQIRGRNSIAQGSEPLFIIDGVPFATNNNSLNQITSALASFPGQGLSPFNGINPSDIESIEILKDADATAIYGSRGANGVILITTKRTKSGATNVNVNVYTGISRVTRTMAMMNTQQYLEMRNEAFKNDGISPDIFSAPDLLVWDTTRYTDFKKLLIGKTSQLSDAQISFSGGNGMTQFLVSGGYHYESSQFSKDLNYKRGAVHLNLNHTSTNHNFNVIFTANYSSDNNKTSSTDLTSYIILPPDLPALYDTLGKLKWEEGGVAFDNPLAGLMRKYSAQTDNLISNLELNYKVSPGLMVKASLGYNNTIVEETSAFPKASQDPQFSSTGNALFANNRLKGWIVEPQADYVKKIGKGKLNVLLGTTWQQIVNKRFSIEASGYTNDALIGSVSGASNTTVADGYSQYRYEAFFGRLNYNWQEKYVLNFTGRRDGSSRFGPNKRFANFAAGGAAWIFSKENFLKRSLPFISYGKLRASYGTTGNDQIGDYQYLDVWRPVSYRYQGASVIPVALFNPDYSWEINKKLEGCIEIGLLKDRILISAAYFRNRSSNQLVNYRLPGQTGFTSIIQNFPAAVQNKGFEFTLLTKNLNKKNFNWTTSANLTIPQNKLIAFPGLSTSSYAYSYVEGKPLNLVYGYHLLGVNSTTGIYEFEDVDKDGVIGSADYVASYNLDPKFYGGLNNNLNYKNWGLNIFLEFKKQIGFNYNNYPIYNFTPGSMFNLPAIMLERWQVQGDRSNIQQFTQTYTPAFDAQYNFSVSDGRFSDASYLRIKNASLSYNLPEPFRKKVHVENWRIYLLAQNLITITNYKGSDPETQNLFVLPPLRTITAGIQLTF